jgi:hypothetical protein
MWHLSRSKKPFKTVGQTVFLQKANYFEKMQTPDAQFENTHFSKR